MTSPAVLNEVFTTPNSSVAASIAVTMPSGSGGRVFALVTGAASSSSTAVLDTTSTGWKKFAQWTNGNLQVAVFSHLGGGGTLTVTSTVNVYFNPYAWRMADNVGIDGTDVAATGTSTAPNPPAFDQFYSRDLLVRAFTFAIGTGRTTAAPSGYSNASGQAPGNAAGGAMDFASKAVTATSEDPGAFTKASAAWMTITLAHWDGGSDWMAVPKARMQAGTDLIGATIGDSLASSADPVPGGGPPSNTMTTNCHATSTAAYFADGLTALKGSKANWFGSNGAGVNVPTYDTRRVEDASVSYTDQTAGPYTLGGGAMTIGTSGQKQAFSPGQAFTHHKVWYLKDPTFTAMKADVNGGTQTTLSGMVAANGLGFTEIAASGNSSAVLNITSQGGSAYILGQSARDNAVKQMVVLNCGFYGCTSSQIAASSTYYDAANVIKALALDWFAACLCSNDTAAAIPLETSKWNVRKILRAARAGGSNGILQLYPYLQSVSEASTDATNAILKAVADEQCVTSLDMTVFPGCTSRAAMVTAGYALSTDNHPTALFRAFWASKMLALSDPGPLSVAVYSDVSMAVALLGSVSRDALMAAEFGAGVAATVAVPVGFQTSLVGHNGGPPLDFLAAASNDDTTQAERLAVTRNDLTGLAEAQTGMLGAAVAPVDVRAATVSDEANPTEWNGTAMLSLVSDETVPLEFRASVLVDRPTPVDARAGLQADEAGSPAPGAAVARDAAAPLEAALTVPGAASPPLEALGGVAGAVTAPTEWQGTAMVTISEDATSPLEILATSAGQAVASAAINRLIAADAAASASTVGQLVAQVTAGIESLIAGRSDCVAVIGIGAMSAGDVAAAIEAARRIVGADLIPVEWTSDAPPLEPPASRIWTIAAEDRVFYIPAEDRTFVIRVES